MPLNDHQKQAATKVVALEQTLSPVDWEALELEDGALRTHIASQESPLEVEGTVTTQEALAATITRNIVTTDTTPGTQVQGDDVALAAGSRAILLSPDADDPKGSPDYTANTGKIHIAGATGAPSLILWPGDSIELSPANLNQLFFTSDVADQTVLITIESVA